MSSTSSLGHCLIKYPIHLRGGSLQLFLSELKQILHFLLHHDLLDLHFPELKDMNMKRFLAKINLGKYMYLYPPREDIRKYPKMKVNLH